MAAWLKLCAGVIVSRQVKLMKRFVFKLSVTILFLCLTVPVFAQKDFFRQFKATRVEVGKIITISLEANPSTGFSWQLVKISDKAVIEFVKKEYAAISGKPAAGSGGIENWSFKTLKKGKAVIIFEYRRPWEKDVPAAKIEEFNVFIK